MPEIAIKDDRVVVEYQKGSGKKIRRFNLGLDHLGDSFVAFTLIAEEKPSGWRVLRAEIDLDDTTANSDDAAADLADVRWHIFPSRERGRKLTPVVTYWEKDGLVLAACLSDRYAVRKIPFAEQKRRFKGMPNPDDLLCWWPSRNAWQVAKESARHLSLFPVKDVAVSFYSLNEWIQRPDVRAEIGEYLADLEEMEDDPEIRASVLAEIAAEEYSRYVRRIRTMLLYYRKKGIPAKVVVGSVRRAEAYFAEKNLDPLDPSAWAAASHVFDAMPDFAIEELYSCGPVGVTASRQKLRAALSLISHWPGVVPGPDAVGAVICAGSVHMISLVAWLNPLAGPDAFEKAASALLDELSRRGVDQVTLADGILPFEVCPCCGKFALRVPDDWLKPEPIRSQKVGRNEPCPCGSGLKCKRCCGAGAGC